MKQMKISRNMVTAAAATVIVAVCLLFAYFTTDSGSSDGYRTEEVPGDYMDFTIWDHDSGEGRTGKIALVSHGEDGCIYMVRTFGTTHHLTAFQYGMISGFLFDIPDDAVIERSETVIISMGTYECDVYRDADGNRYWVESGGMVIIYEGDGFNVIVNNTSMTGDVITDTVSSRTDIQVGDYFSFKVNSGEECWITLYDIDGITDDGDYVVSMSLIDEDGVRTIDRTILREDLLTIIGFTDDLSGMELVGEAMFTSSYGYIPCYIYDDGDMRYMVGKEDGVIYYMWGGDMIIEIIGTSLVSDGAPDHYDGAQEEVTEFTRVMYSYSTRMWYLYVDSISTILAYVTSCDGETMEYSGVEYPAMGEVTYSGPVDGVWTKQVPDAWDINSIKIVSTSMGDRLCMEYCDVENDVVYYVGVYDSVIYRAESLDGDEFTEVDLSLLTTTEFTRGSFDPMYSDALIYTVDDGTIVYMRPYGDGVYQTECMDDSGTSWVNLMYVDTGTKLGTETVETIYGDLECSVYDEGDGDMIWIYEPLHLPVKVVIDHGDSTETWTLMFSNIGVVLER